MIGPGGKGKAADGKMKPDRKTSDASKAGMKGKVSMQELVNTFKGGDDLSDHQRFDMVSDY